MPEKETLQRAMKDKQEGKAPTTQAGEFVREEIEHVRQGKHGVRSSKQAVAIGLSKARRAGVDLPPPEKGTVPEKTRRVWRISIYWLDGGGLRGGCVQRASRRYTRRSSRNLYAPATPPKRGPGMKIDVSNLNADELDELIREAAMRRSQLQPTVSKERPTAFGVVKDPSWYTFPTRNETILQIRSPGHGWLAFQLPASDRAHLLSLLLNHALQVAIRPQGEEKTQPESPAAAGGTLH
jgi:hypothetical protein